MGPNFEDQLHKAQVQYDNQSPEDFEGDTEDDLTWFDLHEEEIREDYLREKYH